MTLLDAILDRWRPNNRCTRVAKRCVGSMLGLVGWYVDMTLKVWFNHLHGFGIGISDAFKTFETRVEEIVTKQPRRVIYFDYLSRGEKIRVKRVLDLDQSILERHPRLFTYTNEAVLTEPATWPWTPRGHVAKQKAMMRILQSKQAKSISQYKALMKRHVVKNCRWKKHLVKTAGKTANKLNKKIQYLPSSELMVSQRTPWEGVWR